MYEHINTAYKYTRNFQIKTNNKFQRRTEGDVKNKKRERVYSSQYIQSQCQNNYQQMKLLFMIDKLDYGVHQPN